MEKLDINIKHGTVGAGAQLTIRRRQSDKQKERTKKIQKKLELQSGRSGMLGKPHT